MDIGSCLKRFLKVCLQIHLIASEISHGNTKCNRLKCRTMEIVQDECLDPVP